ncbi:hypothetical protein ACFOU2_01975 [Bacillus songklensis]|uniref:Uncharacterized protein n=1 Tax=Bacillus songklensis TaxID=1069116 RepID=A0ABV8AZH4_9BACI
MSFLQQEQLYRVEITEPCNVLGITGTTAGYLPSPESFKKGHFGTLPIGTKGWIVKKFGQKYFSPDKDQEGLDLFTLAEQPFVLIPYEKVEGHYKIIS